jgi:excisionase family DNA binding protein
MLRKVQQVAEKLNCSKSTAYALVQKGILPATYIGTSKGLRVADADLEAFIASRRTRRPRLSVDRTNSRAESMLRKWSKDG